MANKAPDNLLDPNIRYTIVQRGFEVDTHCLGKGSFGEVVRAKSDEDNKEYAIKVVHLDKGGRAVKYSERELQLLIELKVSVPNIIKYFHSWIQGDGNAQKLCIQMELCSVNLRAFLRKIGLKSKIPLQGWSQLCHCVFPQILNGLEAIHELGWVHRDIHPGNILIAHPFPSQIGDIIVKIADFGLARQIGTVAGFELSNELTVVPQLEKLSPHVGHELFRAPELYTDKYDSKVDVYSAALVLCFISCYIQHNSTYKTKLRHLKNGELPMEKCFCDKDDMELCNIIEMLLNADPDKRPSALEARKEYLLSQEPHDSTDGSKASKTRFFARKHGEDSSNRCRLEEFTISGLKEAVKGGTYVETGAQELKQVRVCNGKKELVNINCDEDVEEMFQSAEEHSLDIEVVVYEKQQENRSTKEPTEDMSCDSL